MLTTSLNDSFPPPHLIFFNPNLLFDFYCFISRPYSFIFTAFIITRILLLLPLCIFILYHGLQLWRKKCIASSAGAMSHTDCFTYQVVVMELISIIASIFGFCGIYMKNFNTMVVSFLLAIFTWYGELFFHILTCVERYLAVVHPITYMSLKNEKWIRIRNIGTACVWLLCFVGMSMEVKLTIVGWGFFLFTLSLAVVFFCSISVLCVLIHQSPGEHGGVRKKISQSKQRALFIILAILVVLVMRFAWDIIWVVKSSSDESDKCLLSTFGIWFNLPSSLVLPLLFFHKAGKLVCKSI